MEDVKERESYQHRILYEHISVDGRNNILIVPLEMTHEQVELLNRFYEIDDEYMDDEAWDEFYDEIMPDVIDKTLEELYGNAQKYFDKHKDKWIYVADPVRVSGKEIRDCLMLLRLRGEDTKWV